jgi:uncharacterized coiled-coil protein SlyX
MHLQGVAFQWDKDKVNGAGYKTGKQIGLIAQEVEKVLPELVHTDSKGYKTLSYDKLVPVLIEAIKEQQQIVDEQKKALTEKSKVVDEQKQIVSEQKKNLDDQQNAIRLLTERLAKLDRLEARLNKLESKYISAQR